MSDGPDNFRDEELSRRYRALPAELPHPDTDAAIQAAARQALNGARRRPRSAAFYGGLAMAASVTLMMAVLLPSWRSGELQEQVAVQAPQQPVESADLMQDAPAEVAAAAPATPVIGAPAAPAAKRARVATEPVAKPVTVPVIVPVTELAGGAATESATEPATGMADRAAAASAPMAAPMAEADAENAVGQLARQATVAAEAKAEAREQVADSARAERSLSQKARRAMAPAAAPAPAVAMAPMPAQETPAQVMPAPELERMVAATDALLLSGRYAEALARLQVGPVAADAALDSRRDLLRLLVPGESRVLQCTAAAGPASAQALCRLLQQYQAVQRVPAAVKDAVRQALLGEGSDPAPLLHAIADLPEAP